MLIEYTKNTRFFFSFGFWIDSDKHDYTIFSMYKFIEQVHLNAKLFLELPSPVLVCHGQVLELFLNVKGWASNNNSQHQTLVIKI